MRFRLRAFGWHLLGSITVLTLVLGGLYLGWYRWPGWYLADAGRVTLVLAGVDLVVGPLLTFVIAAPAKPRRVLTRDVAVIAAVQLAALSYGALNLWNGRPLYYAFSEDVLQLVQAYDIEAPELELARENHAALLPHWYSLPRWIWAPLPADGGERDRIISSAIAGGSDVIAMPRHYRPWADGRATLRAQLKRVKDIKYFSAVEQKALEARMRAAGLSPDTPDAIAFTGRAHPLLAVFDPTTLTLQRILAAR